MNIKHLSLALGILSLLSAPTYATEPPLRVVASFSILADIAKQMGGEDVSVTSLVGPEQDAHTFQPSPEQAKELAKADIIIVNGLKFEGWMNRLIKASGTKAKLLVASAGVKPRLMEEEEEQHEHGHSHEHHDGESVVDPHAWQDPRFGHLYARNIAGGLAAARPAAKEQIDARLAAYKKELALIDRNAREAFGAIPADKRKIITNHDAFGYMADAYGLTILSPVGLSTEAEPTAADVAKLIKQIRAEKIHAVFMENMSDPRLVQQIAKDTGTTLGGELYADALTKTDGPAPTYLDLLRHNTELLAKALR